jgi:hypothetical protein
MTAAPPSNRLKINDNDTELIQAITSGQTEKFPELVRRYEQRLYNFGRRMCSEYIDQELESEARREIETHVAECLPCFACLQTLKQTIALCRQTGDQLVPAAFSRKLHAMLQTTTKPSLP